MVGAPDGSELVDHVLSRFRPGEKAVIQESVATAAQAVMMWVEQGTEACMNQYNA